jgi:protein involved in polysaccharide export with SLBB domain
MKTSSAKFLAAVGLMSFAAATFGQTFLGDGDGARGPGSPGNPGIPGNPGRMQAGSTEAGERDATYRPPRFERVDPSAIPGSPSPLRPSPLPGRVVQPSTDPSLRLEPRQRLAPPSEFQRFVQQSTGRLLPIYGAAVFQDGGFGPVQAVQVPDSYVIGPGDELLVHLIGAFELVERVVVARDGRITLPRSGPVEVAGLQFGELERRLEQRLGNVYRNFKVSVTVGRLRSIEVYLLGQAKDPGRKVVSSLSTLVSAIFESGGPSSNGSMRGIELRRGGRTIARIDLYEFIARGEIAGDQVLAPGDIIFIPPVGAQAAVTGSVNEPAIFELPQAGGTIEAVLSLTGGLPALAAPQRAQLERVDAGRQPARFVEDLALDGAGLAMPLRAGDILTVFPVSPQFGNAVSLQGNVAVPLRRAHRPGMRVSDLLGGQNALVTSDYWLRTNRGQGIGGLSQPEVNLDYATIQRFDPKTLRTEIIPFALGKALMRDPAEDLVLAPGDVVRIYGPDEPVADSTHSISIEAEFLGGSRRFVWRPGMRVRDVIQDRDWVAQRFLHWQRSRQWPAPTGPELADSTFVASSSDERSVATADRPPRVNRRTGAEDTAVLKREGPLFLPSDSPSARSNAESLAGTAEFAAGMANRGTNPQTRGGARTGVVDNLPGARSTSRITGDAADTAPRDRAAVPRREDINWEYARLVRRTEGLQKTEVIGFNLGRAVIRQDEASNLVLQAGDELVLYTTQELPLPRASSSRLVKISGEVASPGVYEVLPGETLPALLRRAGGLTSEAYVFGTELSRERTREEQRRNLETLVRSLESELMAQANYMTQNVVGADATQAAAQFQLQMQFQRQTIDRLRSVEPSGRIALDLDPAADQPVLRPIALEDGDTVHVPAQPDFVSVFGAVDIASPILYRSGWRLREYLDRAGPRQFADLDALVVLRADGTALTTRTSRGLFGWNSGLMDIVVKPGDAILVPEEVDRRSAYTRVMTVAKDWTQLIYQFGLGAAAFKILRD